MQGSIKCPKCHEENPYSRTTCWLCNTSLSAADRSKRLFVKVLLAIVAIMAALVILVLVTCAGLLATAH